MSQFSKDEIAILTDKALKGLPNRIGERCVVLGKTSFINYDYDVEFDDHEINPVKESELIKPTDEDRQQMDFIFTGNKILYYVDEVTVVKVDYLNHKANIQFSDGVYDVVDFDKLNPIEQPKQVINSLEDTQKDIFEDLLNILFKHYKNQNNTYTVPKELLINMLKGLYMDGE